MYLLISKPLIILSYPCSKPFSTSSTFGADEERSENDSSGSQIPSNNPGNQRSFANTRMNFTPLPHTTLRTSYVTNPTRINALEKIQYMTERLRAKQEETRLGDTRILNMIAEQRRLSHERTLCELSPGRCT